MDKWDQRFMDMAFTIAGWSSCFRAGRSIGCVIVKDKRIMTTGYNGAPAGIKTCREKGECLRDKLGIASGTRMETCYAVHAEQNAIVQAAKLGVSIDGATLYCTHQPCSMCCKMIINSGIKRVVYSEKYRLEDGVELLRRAGIEVVFIDDLH
jgi:dCMP deaminase